jgi:hypothetical protein
MNTYCVMLCLPLVNPICYPPRAKRLYLRTATADRGQSEPPGCEPRLRTLLEVFAVEVDRQDAGVMCVSRSSRVPGEPRARRAKAAGKSEASEPAASADSESQRV